MEQRNSYLNKLADLIISKTWGIGEKVKAVWFEAKVCILDESFRKDLFNLHSNECNIIDLLYLDNFIVGKGCKNCSLPLNAARSWIAVPVHQNLTNMNMNNEFSDAD